MPPLDEFGLIRVWTEGRQSDSFLTAAGVTVGIGDDAAVVSASAGMEWVLAVDTMVEEIHFKPETMDDADIGFKALAANVSDIAAMGGMPKHALVSVSVPARWDAKRMERLYEGLYACADKYGIAIIGGDTTSAPQHLVVAVTVVGCVESGRAIRRSGAKPGQIVFLTGPTGLSAGGLHGMLGQPGKAGKRVAPSPPKRLIDAHRRPQPSVKAGRILLEGGLATSLNDVSDGLASEAWEIAEASGVKLALRETDLPISGELAGYAGLCGIAALDWVLYGGEDYVLLGTADPGAEVALREKFREASLPLFIIGSVEEGPPGVELALASGKSKPLLKRGYNHFAKG
ncbi:thiamine-phosphate kinase [Cohnella yongneupensis]|uniref:Thiamine-monophosphate kinase n=1 Tax=Cohnella yongneupensis TaxID=425006 RepID=A0ABW0R4C5_9BACL